MSFLVCIVFKGEQSDEFSFANVAVLDTAFDRWFPLYSRTR